jgi:hypothetical protein
MMQNPLIAIAAALAVLAAPHPRLYRLTTEYFHFDSAGQLLSKERIVGDYTVGEPGDAVRWTHVTMSHAKSVDGEYSREEPVAFMEGLSYLPARENLLSEWTFRYIPAIATPSWNLVMDTFLFETLVLDLNKVRAASPYHVPSWAVPFGGNRTFKNTDLQLAWVGMVERNKKECALIRFEALNNTVEQGLPAVKFTGRSDYWGDIWVALATGEIESATVHEEMVGEQQFPQPPTRQLVNVVRKGTFERLPDR